MVLGEAVLATAPDHDTAGVVERALSGLPAGWLADAGTLSSRLPAVEILGPAALAYLDPAEFRPPPDDAAAAPLNLDHSGFRQFLLTVGDDDVRESGIEQITTPTFAIHENGRVVAAAGYRDWPCGTAQLSVLTASAARAAAWRVLPPQRPSPTRSGKAGCRSGGHATRPPGASPALWGSANSASR